MLAVKKTAHLTNCYNCLNSRISIIEAGIYVKKSRGLFKIRRLRAKSRVIFDDAGMQR